MQSAMGAPSLGNVDICLTAERTRNLLLCQSYRRGIDNEEDPPLRTWFSPAPAGSWKWRELALFGSPLDAV